ncbi:PAS domain-containing protein [Sediminibacterium sp.]|uniref:PAS domain-containing protein n=1 Tax=Sediminibacterium sp. TaxID=1917865 RepID=UPI003F704DA4
MSESDILQLLPNFLVNSKIYSLVVTDLEGKYIYVNDLFNERFSFLKTHFVGDPVSVAIHPEDIVKCNEVVQQCFLHPDQSFPIQIRKPSEVENDFYWTQWEFSLFKDAQQNPVGILCVGYEASMEEKTNQKLAQTETLLRAMYDSTSDACTFINPNFEFLFLNQLAKNNCLEIFKREPAIGDSIFDFFHPFNHAEFLGYFKRVLNGESIRAENEDGGIWWIFSLFPVYDIFQHIVGIAINVRDITERKQNEIKILQQNERLKQITWQHSHEVRRHIVNIMGLHDLIKNNNLLSDIEKQMQLDELLNETKKLDQVVHAIVKRSIGEA